MPTTEKPYKPAIIDFADIGIQVQYRPVESRNKDFPMLYEWYLDGNPSPELTVLQRILNTDYSGYMQARLFAIDEEDNAETSHLW